MLSWKELFRRRQPGYDVTKLGSALPFSFTVYVVLNNLKFIWINIINRNKCKQYFEKGRISKDNAWKVMQKSWEQDVRKVAPSQLLTFPRSRWPKSDFRKKKDGKKDTDKEPQIVLSVPHGRWNINPWYSVLYSLFVLLIRAIPELLIQSRKQDCFLP